MQVYDSLSGLVGDTPLVRLRSVTRGIPGATVLAKVEYFNPGGSVKDRIALAMVEPPSATGGSAAGRHDRRADVGQHRGRPGASWRRSAATAASSSCPTRWRTEKINVLRAYGAEVVVCPTAVAPTHPRLLLLASRDRLVARDPGRVAARPVLQPRTTRASHYADHRAGDLGADRRAGHALRRRRSAPAGPSPAPAGT